MSVNRFIEDPTTGVIRGQYDEKIDVNGLNSLVRELLRKKATQTFKAVGQEAINGYRMVNSDKKVSMEDGIGLFVRVIDRLDRMSSLEIYDRRSAVWIKAIGENQGRDRLALVEEFIRLVSEFVPTNIVYANGKDSLNCPDCSEPLTINDEICPGCKTVHIKYVSNGVYNDNMEAESLPKLVAVKDCYEKFYVKYLRFQGRYDVKIDPDDLLAIQTQIMKKYKVTDTSARMRDQNRFVMREVLKQLSMIRYQDDINLLMYLIWKYPPPDLSMHDLTIEKNWRASQAVIEANKKPKDPENIDSNDWRLCKELQLIGYDCVEDDFHITSNKDVKKRQEELWKLYMSSRKVKN